MQQIIDSNKQSLLLLLLKQYATPKYPACLLSLTTYGFPLEWQYALKINENLLNKNVKSRSKPVF
ncbi:hypothetical protein [Liquorilactobacillus satsumensis]|uniref:hypothetical protein n=1 Tax=Liquorilactobacillus satsumensis TaxID=259059 RepID=UPI0006D0F2C4|nr:hypothetical protein [Liquorilactobacillus satsumensis]MCC7667612.1 hypothetical protein [Liquorilactobacillus satsumensis]MCP9313186.1 hypothetical protein [Liquorilactobacillus satsumensis]MCP9329423.1 hypothetical protein [Liquorilactobacillus satsumensis]MCP9357914.1 hypothetical protein [Liquorilactobacillus satsumensis]MCP9360291.1 hypothetical protein [Liquorilactobacillus satsumensis]